MLLKICCTWEGVGKQKMLLRKCNLFSYCCQRTEIIIHKQTDSEIYCYLCRVFLHLLFFSVVPFRNHLSLLLQRSNQANCVIHLTYIFHILGKPNNIWMEWSSEDSQGRHHLDLANEIAILKQTGISNGCHAIFPARYMLFIQNIHQNVTCPQKYAFSHLTNCVFIYLFYLSFMWCCCGKETLLFLQGRRVCLHKVIANEMQKFETYKIQFRWLK